MYIYCFYIWIVLIIFLNLQLWFELFLLEVIALLI